jgi:hypothetical protein
VFFIYRLKGEVNVPDTVRNKEKKYPLKPCQLITERFDCEYCKRTNNLGHSAPKTNIEKCAFCGFDSFEFWRGMLISFAEVTLTPVALIERVKCEKVNEDDVLSERKYQKIGDTLYHNINLSSAASYGIAESECYKMRVEDKEQDFTLLCGDEICHLDIWCYKKDVERADGLFRIDGVELSKDDVTGLRYWSQSCEASGLNEIFFPIYTQKESDSCSDIVGVLIVGQIAIGKAEKDDFDVSAIPEGASPERIIALRKEGWKNAIVSNRQFLSIEEALV